MAKKPETREIATIKQDPMVFAFQTMLAPTDETLRRRGSRGLETYDEIRRDPHAYALLQKRALEVCSREWAVTPASESRADKKAALLVEEQLKGINFDRLTRGLLGAVVKGFAVAEIIWENRGGIWTAAAVKVKKQRRFAFTIDGALRLLTRENGIEGIPLPDRKFVVHRHSIDDDDDDPYGVGLGSVLFWPAWFKRQALGNWLRATERFAAPTVHASYQGQHDEAKQEQLLAAIRAMANDAGIVTPEGVTIALLEASRGGGGDVLESMNRYLDELMSEAVLGETLTTNSGERGARSLGEIHNEVRIAIAKADADLISLTLRETLCKWIVELNLPGTGIPHVWRDFSEAEDLDKKVARDETITRMGYRPKSVDYINETYGGDWIEKETAEPPAGTEIRPDAEASFTDRLFADRDGMSLDALTDKLETASGPLVNALLAAIRDEVMTSVDFDDLNARLLRLSGELGIDDLAKLLEEGFKAAALAGHASVIDDQAQDAGGDA